MWADPVISPQRLKLKWQLRTENADETWATGKTDNYDNDNDKRAIKAATATATAAAAATACFDSLVLSTCTCDRYSTTVQHALQYRLCDTNTHSRWTHTIKHIHMLTCSHTHSHSNAIQIYISNKKNVLKEIHFTPSSILIFFFLATFVKSRSHIDAAPVFELQHAFNRCYRQ